MLEQKGAVRSRFFAVLILALIINILLLLGLFLPHVDLEFSSFMSHVSPHTNQATILTFDDSSLFTVPPTPPLQPLPQQQQVLNTAFPLPDEAPAKKLSEKEGSPTLRSGAGSFGVPPGEYDHAADLDLSSLSMQSESDHKALAQPADDTESDEKKIPMDEPIKKIENTPLDKILKKEGVNVPENSASGSTQLLTKVLQEKENPDLKASYTQDLVKKDKTKHRNKNARMKKNDIPKQNLTFEQLARGFITTLNRGGSGLLDRQGDGSTVASAKDLILQRYMERLIWVFQYQSRSSSLPPNILANVSRGQLVVTLKLCLYETGIMDSVDILKPSLAPSFDDLVVAAFKNGLFAKVPNELLNEKKRFETTVSIYA